MSISTACTDSIARSSMETNSSHPSLTETLPNAIPVSVWYSGLNIPISSTNGNTMSERLKTVQYPIPAIAEATMGYMAKKRSVCSERTGTDSITTRYTRHTSTDLLGSATHTTPSRADDIARRVYIAFSSPRAMIVGCYRGSFLALGTTAAFRREATSVVTTHTKATTITAPMIPDSELS